MARPVWSGALSLGLVTVPVELYPAVADLLVEGGDAPGQAAARRKAALAVAARAKDPEDCARLLEMLGLHRNTIARKMAEYRIKRSA